MPELEECKSNLENMLHIGTMMGLPAALESLGFNAAQVLLSCGVDIKLFSHSDNVMTFSERGRLMAHCAELTQCPHLGLLIGQHGGLHSLGLIGIAAKHAVNVRSALLTIIENFHIHTQGSVLTLQEEGNIAILSYQINQLGTAENHQVGVGAVAIYYNILHELLGMNWKAKEVWFIQPPPTEQVPYRHFFESRLRFNAEQNAIVFDAKGLDYALNISHPDLYRLLTDQLQSQTTQKVASFHERVRAALRSGVLGGNTSAHSIAAQLSLQPRTLNRHLKANGLSFQRMLDETKFSMARQMLRDTDINIQDIAIILNYADARSFSRSFNRWSGNTPAQWRKEKMKITV